MIIRKTIINFNRQLSRSFAQATGDASSSPSDDVLAQKMY
jgi:hypothetical protein